MVCRQWRAAGSTPLGALVQRHACWLCQLEGRGQGELQGQAVADAGLYLGTSAVRHPMLAIAAALSQLDQGFDIFNIGCIRTHVRVGNHAALRLNEQLGYRQYGQDLEFIALELQPVNYYAARERLRRFFR